MGKYSWHVSTREIPFEMPRHYNHLTQLYKFIIRNPKYFEGKALRIFNHNRMIIKMDFSEVWQRVKIDWTEGPERKHIINLGKVRGIWK